MSNDTTRDAFEAWCRREGFEPTLWIADAPDRGYAHARVMDYWTGWQAATEQGKRQPLSDDELGKLWDGHTVPVFVRIGINPIVFARAVEAAHGITATPQSTKGGE